MSHEEAQQILEAALEDGKIPLGVLKVLAAGAARSGKSLSKKHIFGMKCDSKVLPSTEASPVIEFSPSTGVYEPPVCTIRSFSVQMFDTRLPVWEPLTEEKLIKILAQKLSEGSIHGDMIEVVRNRMKGSSPGSLTPVAEAGSSTGNDSKSKRTVVHTLTGQPREHSPRLQEQFKLQLIFFLDSGGQPQLHEVLPALSHNICLIMLFLKLNERLDDFCCTTFTDENGKDYSMPPFLTNKQMLVQLVHTMMSKPLAESERCKVMVVGTHFDLIDKCSETLDQKNAALRRLFRNIKKQLLTYRGKIIFPVNALDFDNESEAFGEIRGEIEKMTLVSKPDTPLSWFLFQNDLMEYGKQGKGIANTEKCLEIAGRLKMGPKSLHGALKHFNDLSIFLHTSELPECPGLPDLPDLVFIDPQLPLKLVNECVAFAYKVWCNEGPVMSEEECSCWKKGEITCEMLKKKEFSSCFVPDVFDAEHAINIFQRLHIVAATSKGFIMPCILPPVSDEEIESHLPQCDENVAVLVVHFTDGCIPKVCIPNGTFCATHNCMRSVHGWTTDPEWEPIGSKELEHKSERRKVENESEAPAACLYQNMVKLQHPEEAVTITFVHDSNMRHFEVHVEIKDEDIKIHEVCPDILDNILNSISIAEQTFHFEPIGATEAFLCPCGKKPRHAATLNEKKTSLKCTETQSILGRKSLKKGHKVWLKDICISGDEQCSVTADVPSSLADSPPDLDQLHVLDSGETSVKIRDAVAAKWEGLAAQLKFKPGVIDIIERDHKGCSEDAFDDLMKRWLKGAGKQPPSWRTLLQALDAADFKTLASDVKKVLNL